MTERLADIRSRIAGMRQLGSLVNGMRGIAAARAQQARSQLAAVDRYTATIANAMARVQIILAQRGPAAALLSRRGAIVVFCAEQGFAGAFSERVLNSIRDGPPESDLFLIGTRGHALAEARHVAAGWSSPMPAHSLGIPKLADRICDAIYTRIAGGELQRLDAVFGQYQSGGAISVVRRRLLPLVPFEIASSGDDIAPMLNLSAEAVLSSLAADYLHAQLCHAALHAFTAENEMRMHAMAAAHRQVEDRLVDLQATERIVRQEEITEEIVELAAGYTASRV